MAQRKFRLAKLRELHATLGQLIAESDATVEDPDGEDSSGSGMGPKFLEARDAPPEFRGRPEMPNGSASTPGMDSARPPMTKSEFRKIVPSAYWQESRDEAQRQERLQRDLRGVGND